MSTTKFVTYAEFGAVGDGVTNDFPAIYAAHEYANEHKLPVVVDDGKTYYIGDTTLGGGKAKAAVIKTDVSWGSSRFIIDDTDVDFYDGTKMAATFIFDIVSDYEPVSLTDPEILSRIGKVGEGTKMLNLALGYPAMLVVRNENERVFRRYGVSYFARGGQSSPKQELIVVDGDGNISPDTPFMFDYEELTSISVYRTDIVPITVKGGVFTTRACRVNALDPVTGKKAGYYARGIRINRSHTTLDGIEHYITGDITTREDAEQGLKGPHYRGFYVAECADGVTIKNCVLTGRRYYNLSGTYEFSGNTVNKIHLINCQQSNFTIENEYGETVYSMAKSPITKALTYWGIGGTNFCKNMEYIGCKLSRFDAHQGLYNGRVKDSTLNFMELTGKGEMVFENMDWYSAGTGDTYNSLAYLRNDYGSTWEGTITFKNCTANVSSGEFYISEHSFSNWNFGYTCYYPNLVIDNLTVKGLDEGAKIHLVTENRSVKREPNMHLPKTLNVRAKNDDGSEGELVNTNPIVPPKFIKIINNKQGNTFYLPKADFFANTEKVGVTEE